MQFQELVARHIGLSLRKQLAFADFLGEHSWSLDLEGGVADFGQGGSNGRRHVYPAQILGTEAEASGTWLWAWANHASNLPKPVLRCASRIRAFGRSEGIAELLRPDLPSAGFPGHLLASLGSGICQADCYYRGPYDGGAVFFLLFGTPLTKAPPTSALRASNVLMEAISQFEIADQRLLAVSYLRADGFQFSAAPERIVATAPGGGVLTISFDREGLISEAAAVAV